MVNNLWTAANVSNKHKKCSLQLWEHTSDEFVKRTKCHTNASDANKQDEAKKEAHERWMTQVFMKNADKQNMVN